MVNSKSLPTGAGRKCPAKSSRRVYVIANPDGGSTDPHTRSFCPLPPLPNASPQSQDRAIPNPPQPSPINADDLGKKYQLWYILSDLALSSPSTPTNSPALEPAHPPSTPGRRSIPSINFAQGGDLRNPSISHADNFVEKVTAPFNHVRRGSSGNNVPPATGSVRVIHLDFAPGPPDARVSSPPCITIGRPSPNRT